MQPTQIIKELQKRSKLPLENPGAIEDALKKAAPITFFNWECPPRKMSKTGNGTEYVDYDIDLPKIFRGEMIDDFTELPRVVELAEQETRTLAWLQSLGIQVRFVKLIADTNAFYLTPESLSITGKMVVEKRFEEFKKLIAERLRAYPAGSKVYRFTELISDYQALYDQTYAKALSLLQNKPGKLVPLTTVQAQIERTKHHMGMTDQARIKDFALKTIASYAAEGIMFTQLTNANLGNCVWLNNHEVDQRTITITNCYRKLIGEDNLPMVFLSDIPAN
jgi:hypothetical protein